MPQPIRVLHYGLGPIGARIARLVAARPGLISVGAVDIDPAKAGKDLGTVAKLGQTLQVPVQSNLPAALEAGKPDIVLHATGSHVPGVLPQFLALAEAGLPVVSTCEELSYPWFHHPDEARRIDGAARRSGIAILSTGINPGFIMDNLAVILSGVCPSVTGVRVRRVVDLSIRRKQLQQKVGVNLTGAEFAARKAQGGLGHVGLPESVAMIAAGLDWRLERVEQTLEPVIAPCALDSALGPVAEDKVQGQHQIAHVHDADQVILRIHDIGIGGRKTLLGQGPDFFDSLLGGDMAVKRKVVGGHEAAHAVFGVGQLFTDLFDQPFRKMLEQALPGILGQVHENGGRKGWFEL